MLTVEEIKKIIDEDAVSDRKRQAKEGQRYYEGDHDIKKKRIFFVNADGELQEDKTKSNYKIPHPFFTELVDQEVQFLLSGEEGFMHAQDPDFQKVLDERFNNNCDFLLEFSEVLTDTVVNGFGYMYAYMGEDGQTHFQCADSKGVVEVRAKETNDRCDYVIYWYVDRITPDGKRIKRVEVWDKTHVHYFNQVGDGEIMPDTEEEHNPRPHILYTKGKKLYEANYGTIPFFLLKNNRKQLSGLNPVKAIIDDYDIMNCGLSNNIEDANEVTYFVKGFEGDNLDELILNIKAKKAVGLAEGGGVEVETVNIPFEARKAKMEIDKEDIYHAGMGFNSTGLKDSSATTNLQIQMGYQLLQMKTTKLEANVKQFLGCMLDIVINEVNKQNDTDYKKSEVTIDFKPQTPTNAKENADIEHIKAQTMQTNIDTYLNLQAKIGDEVLLKKIAEEIDVDYDELKKSAPKPEDDPLYKAQEAVKNAPVESGGVIG